jgi:hypothetical protein
MGRKVVEVRVLSRAPHHPKALSSRKVLADNPRASAFATKHGDPDLAKTNYDARTAALWRCVVPLSVLAALFALWRSLLSVSPVSVRAKMLWDFEFRTILALWVYVDRQALGFRSPYYEFDTFVFFAWPFVLPYYLYRTRGALGLAYTTAVYALYFVA